MHRHTATTVIRLLLAAVALVLAASLVPAAAQVASPDAPDGSPRAGADPADQPHPSSLTRVAQRGRPSDVEDDRVNTGKAPLAKDVRGTARKVLPSEVLDEESRRGGCVKGYGQPGQCLPKQPPAQRAEHAGHGAPAALRKWTCTDVRLLFKDGLQVDRADRLRLDSNKDGVACGPQDA